MANEKEELKQVQVLRLELDNRDLCGIGIACAYMGKVMSDGSYKNDPFLADFPDADELAYRMAIIAEKLERLFDDTTTGGGDDNEG